MQLLTRRPLATRRFRSKRRRGVARANGILVLAAIVAAGILSGAAYYRWKQPKLAAALEARLAAAPTTAEGRLAEWHRSCAPMIHHRLTQVARLSQETPWLVTHAVAAADGGPPELWGVDVDQLPRELSHLEDLRVVVALPAPRPLGRLALEGDASRHVPVYGPDTPAADPAARLAELARWFLGGLPDALTADIEGAELVIEVEAGTAPAPVERPDR